MFDRIRNFLGTPTAPSGTKPVGNADKIEVGNTPGFGYQCKRIKDRDTLLDRRVFGSRSGNYKVMLPVHAFRVLEESEDGDLSLVDPPAIEYGGSIFYDRIDFELISLSDPGASFEAVLHSKIMRCKSVGMNVEKPNLNDSLGMHVFISEQAMVMQSAPIIRMGFSAVKPWKPAHILLCTARLYNENGFKPPSPSFTTFMKSVLSAWENIEPYKK